MALTTVAKLGASGALIVGAILGPTLASSFTSPVPVEHPANVQGLLNWEQANGGCKIFMAISYEKGSLYRPGDEKKQAITDVLIDKLLATLNSDNNSENKSKCAEKNGKALMFAHKNDAWTADTNDWKNKGGDVTRYSDLFASYIS